MRVVYHHQQPTALRALDDRLDHTTGIHHFECSRTPGPEFSECAEWHPGPGLGRHEKFRVDPLRDGEFNDLARQPSLSYPR